MVERVLEALIGLALVVVSSLGSLTEGDVLSQAEIDAVLARITAATDVADLQQELNAAVGSLGSTADLAELLGTLPTVDEVVAEAEAAVATGAALATNAAQATGGDAANVAASGAIVDEAIAVAEGVVTDAVETTVPPAVDEALGQVDTGLAVVDEALAAADAAVAEAEAIAGDYGASTGTGVVDGVLAGIDLEGLVASTDGANVTTGESTSTPSETSSGASGNDSSDVSSCDVNVNGQDVDPSSVSFLGITIPC